MLRRIWALASAVSFLVSAPAWGWCRATNCGEDPEDACLKDEASGCVIDGLPLGWPRAGKVTFALDAAGLSASERGEWEEQAQAAVRRWSNVECDGGPPNLDLKWASAAENGGAESIPGLTVVIRYEASFWEFGHDVVARTILDYDRESGWLNSAEIWLNGVDNAFAAEPSGSEVELGGVLSHEIGHALGLDHSLAPGATMSEEAERIGTDLADFASLDEDDEDGYCALYPPEDDVIYFDLSQGGRPIQVREQPGTPQSGCSVPRPTSGEPSMAFGAALLGILAFARLARRRAAF